MNEESGRRRRLSNAEVLVENINDIGLLVDINDQTFFVAN
jgi:hypothetical protein